MKNKILFVIVYGFIVCSIISGQAPGPKWEKVFESTEQIIYVDTSSIKQFENQISLLSISNYKTPQIITSLNKEAGSIKSQLLFNAASKKYTVIGTLYYDKNLKILGETSLPGFASSTETFSVPIEDNESMTAIFNKAVGYLKSGLNTIEQKEFSKDGTKSKELLGSDQKKNSKVDNISRPVVNDSSKALERVSQYLSKRDSVQRASIHPTAEISKQKKESVQLPIPEKKNPAINTKEYTSSSAIETNPKSTIFKEGLKYSFQLSSWRNRAKAESEVAKLKREGHSAFIAEGSLNGQRRYRVRIGYFNSLEETEQYMKKMR